MLKERVMALCSRVGLGMPVEGEDGGFSLHFAGGLSVNAGKSPWGIDLRGALRRLPEDTGDAAADAREKLCARLLTLALGRAAKECERFLPCLVRAGEQVELRLTLPQDVAQEDFDDAMERFLNLMETWRALSSEEERPAARIPTVLEFGLRP